MPPRALYNQACGLSQRWGGSGDDWCCPPLAPLAQATVEAVEAAATGGGAAAGAAAGASAAMERRSVGGEAEWRAVRHPEGPVESRWIDCPLLVRVWLLGACREGL